MATPVYSQTLGGMAIDLALTLPGCVIQQGTADSGSTTSLVDDELVDADDSRVLDASIYIGAGGGAGDKRRVSAFSAGSDAITPAPNFSGSISSSSTYALLERWNGYELELCIKRAARRILRFILVEQSDLSIVVGNMIQNGTVFMWTAGASSAPDNWTLTGASAAIAQETVLAKAGPYSAKLTNGSSQTAALSQSAVATGRGRGLTVATRAWVFASDTTPATTWEFTDGVTTVTATHGGTGWELLEPTALEISAKATELTYKLNIALGAQINTYLAYAFCPGGKGFGREHDLDADQRFVWLGDVWVSGTSTGNGEGLDNFDDWIDPGAYRIWRDTTRKMRLSIDELDGRVLRVEGWANPTELTTATTAWAGNPEAILPIARAMALQLKGLASERDVADAVALVKGEFSTPVPSGAKHIEVN